jgi:type II secretory pathway component GspD/PulD (secretin)
MPPPAATRSVRRAVLRLLPTLLVLLLAVPALGRVVRVYEVRHRIAAELVPLVESALGSEGRVVSDDRTNALVLSGEPAAVEDAIALLGKLDARLRTVVLRYAEQDAATLAKRGVHVDWRVDTGSFRVGNVRGPAPGGLQVGVRLDESALQQGGAHGALLRILEGESGRIATGVGVPLTSRQLVRRPRGTVYRETTQLVSAESGLEAQPRVLGDGRIELSLRPFHDRLGPDGRIETAGAETRLVLSPGETLVLGSLARSEQGERREALAGAGRAEESGGRLLLISATVE